MVDDSYITNQIYNIVLCVMIGNTKTKERNDEKGELERNTLKEAEAR